MTVALREYQREAVAKIEQEWSAGVRSTLLVMATGTGKTVVMAKVIEDIVRAGGRVLLLAHRGELLEQAAEKLRSVSGLVASVEKAENTSTNTPERVTVGSVQTLQRQKRLEALGADRFSHIFIDEAHHAVTGGYRTILDYFSDARVLGVTATADRADKRNLGEVFETLAYEYDMVSAIRDGYLCPIEARTIPLKIDLTQVKQRAGDYAAEEIGTALDPYLYAIAEEMEKAGLKERRTVCFLPLIATSKKFSRILSERGFSVAEVNGQSTEREKILTDFAKGRYNVLCNSLLLTEGWDCPPVDTIVNLRPTKSRPLYTQIVGRGTRLSPETGKTELLLLDFLWLVSRLDLIRPAHVIASGSATPEVIEEMVKEQTNAPGTVDLLALEDTATASVIEQREQSAAKELAAQRKKRGRLVDPLQYEMSIADADLAGYMPSFGWEMAPISDAQKQALENFGIAADSMECAGKASLMLDRLQKRRAAGLSTPKQIRLLERYGFLHVGTWSLDAASSMITRIAANSWRVPASVNPQSYTPQK